MSHRAFTSGMSQSFRLKKPKFLILLILVLILVQTAACCFLPKGFGKKKERVLMTVTAYCACRECCEWKRQCCIGPTVYATGRSKGKRKKVGITADGTRARKGIIAADISLYPYGTRMFVPGYGWGEVHDIGRAIKGNHIDLFFKSHQDAVKWGRKKLWVTVIR
jgi:3D (Asp-Asp-Asp) domain-containing protein